MTAASSIVRVNLDRADPPSQVIDAFREVQAAEQERDRLQREADAYANRVLAEARGQAAQTLEQAEAYRAQTVNDAVGQASRFSGVLTEYLNAEDVTRRRIYLETMEHMLGDMDKVILDPAVAGGENGGQRRRPVPAAQRADPQRECSASRAPRPRRRGTEPMRKSAFLLPALVVIVALGLVLDLRRRRAREGAGAAVRPDRPASRKSPGWASRSR